MKRSALFISMVLLLVSLVGVTSAQETTIRYFTFSAAPDHLEDLDTIIAAFQEENPGIAIEVETAPFADYFTLCLAPRLFRRGYPLIKNGLRRLLRTSYGVYLERVRLF